MKTASQKRAELKGLAKKSRDNIFSMLKLADEILKDAEYVDEFGGEDLLMDHMQDEEFAHFGGSPSLSEMLRAYRANPSKGTWSEYKHNIWAMIELANPKKEGTATERVNWKARCKEAEFERDQLRDQVSEQRQLIDRLQDEVVELREENATLKGRLIELEKIVKRPALSMS